MKVKLFISLTLMILCVCQHGTAQESNTNLNVIEIGQGMTEPEAIANARSIAMEQVSSVFISNSTELINNSDRFGKLVTEEAGIITSAEKVISKVFPRDRHVIVMKFEISLDKLRSAIQAFGTNMTVDLNQFTIKIKRQVLEEKNEMRVVGDLTGILHEPMQLSFDYEIISGSPQSTDAESKKWKIPLTAVAKTNDNIDLCAEFFINTMKSISIAAEEVNNYKTLNKTYFPVYINYIGNQYSYYLRKDITCRALISFQENWEFYTRLFEVKSGLDASYGNGNLWNYTKIYKDQNAKDLPDGEDIYKFNGNRIWNNNITYLGFNFLTKNQNAAVYRWDDERPMSQIEKMTGYTIKPLGIVSYYYIGGYVVKYENGHGYVVAPFDIGNMNWEEATKACKELIIGGVSGWDLPSEAEISSINLTLFQRGITGFRPEAYWTNQQNSGSGNCFPKAATLLKGPVICPYVVSFNFGWGSTLAITKDQTCHVRPIRRF